MTDYLALAQARAPQPEDQEQENPYLPLAREAQSLQQNRVRTVLETALKDNPDTAAERLRISQQSGVPLRIVERNLDEIRVKEQARMVDLARMAQESPVLYRQLTDPTFTTTSVDDLDTLKNIERSMGRGVAYVMGADGKGGLPKDLAGAATTVGLGATVGVGKMIFDMAAVVNDLIGWDTGAASMRTAAKRAGDSMRDLGFEGGTSTRDAIKSGLQSSGTNLALLPAGLTRGLYSTASQAASTVAGMMAAGVGADAFNRAREQGKNELQAGVYAIPEAAFEYVFERIPASKLFGDIAANTGLLKTLGKQAMSDGWTEQVTTLAQDFNEWMNLNPDKTLGEFIQERPEAAYQTFVATLVGVGVQTSTIKGIDKIVQKASDRQLQFEQDAFNERLKLAGQSMLRMRSSEQFRSHIQQVVDENPEAKAEVFIDAEVLNQMPAELLEQLPESVREQIPGALETRSVVAIPMADVLTIAPGTPLEQALNDNVRMTPDSPSKAEAQLVSDMLQQDAERVLAQAADQDAWSTSAEAVKTTILDQLNAAGRFTPDVNDAYATLQANFFSTMAARTGMTPQELYDRYSLRVQASGQAGGQAGGVLNAGGRPGTVMYHVSPLSKFDGTRATSIAAAQDEYNRLDDLANTTEDTAEYDQIQSQMKQLDKLEKALKKGTRAFGDNAGIAPDSFYGSSQPEYWRDVQADELGLGYDNGGIYAVLLKNPVEETQVASGMGQMAPEAEISADNVAAILGPFKSKAEADAAVAQQPQFNQTTTTVEVDGKTRPALNSNGQAIHPTLEGVRNFWRWFGDSKVVDADGRPLVVYHGTTKAGFTEFDTDRGSKVEGAYFFTSNKRMARSYSGIPDEVTFQEDDGEVYSDQDRGIYSTYLKIENPHEFDFGGANWDGTLNDPIYNLLDENGDIVDTVYTLEDAERQIEDGDAVEYQEETNMWTTTDSEVRDAMRYGNDGAVLRDVEDNGSEFNTYEAGDVYVVFDPTQIKSATGNSGAFNGQDANILRQDQRDLMVTHNLTADNLLHAAKMGGIAVPSLAVTRKDNPLTGFGEITLIGPPEMADPKGYASTKVFGADIYSPRYPSVERELDKKGVTALVKKLQPMTDKLGARQIDTQELERNGQRVLERNTAVMATFLTEQGIEPSVVMRTGMDDARRARLEQFGMGPFMDTTNLYDLLDNQDFVKAAVAEARDAYASLGKRDSLVSKLDTDEDFQRSIARDVAYKIIEDAKLRKKPEADSYQTQTAMEKQIADADLANAYQQFVADALTSVTKSERIFQGFTNSGNRKYIPHTLENVVKLLKKELRGGESFNYGVGSLRAKFTPQFKSVAEIRKNKDRLISAADFEKVKGEIDAEFLKVAAAIDPNLSLDTASAILEDAAKKGVKSAAKGYGHDISDEAATRAAEFLTRLRTLPTAYFEAKILREVSLSEFKAAVVPEGVNPKAVEALRAAGVTDIRTYAKSNEADRAAKIGEFNDLFFQQARGTYNPQTLLITLGENSDLSTFLHESGHFFLEVLADLASQPNAPADVQDDMAKVLAWFGIRGDETVGGADAGGSSELAQMAVAVRAEIERAKSPVTGKPEFALYDAEGNRLGVYRNALTADEAVSNFNNRREVQRQPEPQVRVDAPQPTRNKEPRSNWKIVRGQKFTNLDADDGYLYHVTSSRAATDIIRSGLVPNSPRAFGDAYAGHSANRVFLTERSGVSFWQEKVGQNLQALYDRPPAVTVVRIPKNKITTQLQPDEIGSADARRPAYYAEGEVLFQTDGKFKPNLPTDNTQPAGRTPLEVWNAMTLDQKRQYHERWAESFEQYLLEGKAPSAELQPLFRRFRSWLVNVYKSLTHFMRGRDLKLNDEIRKVFDRLVATDEQIAQAEETAGMLPDFDATNEAIEKLTARSLRDLKWAVNARNKKIRELQKQAKELRKDVEAEVTAEVNAMPEVRAKEAIDELRKSTPEYKAALAEWKAQRQAAVDQATTDITTNLLATEGAGLEGLKKGQFLAKNRRRIANEAEGRALDWERRNPKPERTLVGGEADLAMVADQTGYSSVEDMLAAIDAFGRKADVIEGLTDQRMLERHGDLVDQRAIEDAATEAVHNDARARALATELKAQADALNPREQTGMSSNGRPVTVNALERAAKEFAKNLATRRRIKDLKSAAAQHRAAEARAGKAWQKATTDGKTQEAVQAKRDQLLNNQAVRALQDAQAEAKKIVEFFRRVTDGSNEKTVERGRDPDVVNAMRAILASYDVAPRLEKGALEYMEVVARNDPAMHAALAPSVQAALNNAKPLSEMTMEELRGLNDELRAMWDLAKRSRQMEVDGNLLDIEEAADQLVARMGEIGIPNEIPGERQAISDAEERGIKLQFAKAILSRVEQWAERMDGKLGGPFLRLVFQPIKDAADRYRTDRVAYRKQFTKLLENVAPALPPGPIAAPELGYTFGAARDSGTAELLHAILHTGNDSNKRKLLLGRGWATENADGALDTSRWDAFMQRMTSEGKITKAHYDFAQGVWDLLEQMKPLAQETHRNVFGRYFAEVTANEVVTPFGTYRGGYVPAQTDSRLVTEAKIRELAEGENESMAYAFPSSPSGFTKSRVEYNRPLLLDIRALAQHMDKVLLFSHMQGAVTDVRRLLSRKNVSYALDRVQPGAYEGMLIPWLNRAAKHVVETPVMGDRKISRFLSGARSRAGMAMMFANLSNTAQQITGFSLAAVKVKPGLLMKATARAIANPLAMRKSVADASAYMKGRMLNETSAMTDAVESILVNPSVYEKAQAWSQHHAYFMQSAVDNFMSPIVWTGAYNQAVEQGESHEDAVRFADGTVRQTQGSTLPEDISRFESGPAYARLFTQFVSYFNMMANTNATAMSQIVGEMGLKKGAGKLVYVALAGLLVPIWVAEAIAQAFRGGPEDDDDDGYLDDWLAAVFGLGTLKGLLAQVPIVGQAGQLVLNRFNDNPADDKFSLSPAVSLIESAVSSPSSVYKAIVDEGNAQKAVRDVAAAATLTTGLPFYAAARPIGYLAGVAQGKTQPTSGVDAVRGTVTGAVSPESRTP